MPFTIPEALEDLPELLSLVQKIQSLVAGLPASTSFKADADLIAAVLPDLGALIDTIKAQAAS